MNTRKRGLWEILCLLGIPQFVMAVVIGILFTRWWYQEYTRYDFDITSFEDMKMILLISGAFWLYVVLMNLIWISNPNKKISLFTWLDKYKYEPPEESGRKWKAQHPPVDEEYLADDPEGLVLGRYKKHFVRFPIRKGHALSAIILGTPGSGKSCLLLTMLIYQLNKPLLRKEAFDYERPVYFILDAKPELLRKSSFPGDDYIRELSISDRSKWGWNCYFSLRPDASDDEILTELDVIVRAFIESPKESTKNEFFYESARTIFKFMALAEYRKGRSFMQTVDKLMDGNMAEIITKILENAEGKPELLKVRKGLNAYKDKEGEAIDNIEMTFRQSMAVFQKDATKYFLDGNPQKLSPQTLEDRISMAFTIKTTQIKEYKTILRLVVMQLIHHLEDRDEDSSHLVTLVIDEAYRLGVINWIDFLSVCRSKQVSCILAFQSLSQMQSVWSKEDADSLLEMVSAIAVLSCASENTAKMICSLAGEYHEEKIQVNVGGKTDGSYSLSYETKKILQPVDLMKLKRKKEIILFLDGEYYRADVENAKYYKIPELNRISKRCVAAHKQEEKITGGNSDG